ncbi:hypothetical protein C8R47DRAFT_1313163 [Mycena vitilis]|nr:hypothetical protein C8R47DRAFT_1313163 [Mycena vitilis]
MGQTHKERVSQRLDARTSWGVKTGVCISLVAVYYLFSPDEYHLLCAHHPPPDPSDYLTDPGPLFRARAILFGPLQLTTLEQLLLNYRAKTLRAVIMVLALGMYVPTVVGRYDARPGLAVSQVVEMPVTLAIALWQAAMFPKVAQKVGDEDSATAISSTVAADADAVHFSLPAQPDKASVVPKGYVGFGIEMKSLPDYLGLAAPNNLTKFLLNHISTATNSPVHLRVGGTSGDNSVFSSALTTKAITSANLSQCRLHTNITLGVPWVRSFKHLDASLARFTVQIPLARKNVSNGMKFASACLQNMPGGVQQLDAFEIGNEPNFYPTFGCGSPDRGKGFGPPQYATEWNNYAAQLKKGVPALQGSANSDFFQSLALASNVDLRVWNLSKIFNPLDQGGFVKTVSQHYYQGDGSGNLKDELLTHSTTVSKMESNFRANAKLTADRKVAFVLGEVGPAIGGGTNSNPLLFGTLGSALWSFDFLLYGMSMGINRVSMQLGTNFRMSAWQPVDGGKGHPKAVAGNYYGILAGAHFIGAAGDFKIRTLPMDDHPEIVGYAGYNAEKLTKVAVLNLHLWNKGDGVRPRRNISLTALGADVKSVRVSRLASPDGANDEKSISFAGNHFTAANDGTTSDLGQKPATIAVKNGTPVTQLSVAASEALLIEVLRA